MSREAVVEIIRWVRRAAAVSSVVTAAGFTGQQIAHHLRGGPSSEQETQLAAALNQSTESSTNSRAQAHLGGNKGVSRAGMPLDPRSTNLRMPSSPQGVASGMGGPGGGENPSFDPGAGGAVPNSTATDAAAAMNNSRAAGSQFPNGFNNPATQAAARQPGAVGEPQAGEPAGAAGGSGSTAASGDAGNAGTAPYASPTPSSTTAATPAPTFTTPTLPPRALVTNFTPPATAYAGASFSIQPSFAMDLTATNKVDQTVSDTVTLGAYSENTCTTKATGTIAATKNPIAFSFGLATFSGASFTPAHHAEEAIYLGAATTNIVSSACSTSTTLVLQHFNAGVGYVNLSSGVPGFAGASATARNDVTYAIGDDGNGNYLVGGTSANASGGSELFIARYFPDGTLDTSFATNGIFLFQNNQNGPAGSTAATRVDQIRGIFTDSTGNIVAVGTTSDSTGGTDIFLLRLTNAGAPDTSLSSNGLIVFNAGKAGFAGAPTARKSDQVGLRNPLLIDTDGSYLVAISSANAAGGLESGLMRIVPAGTLSLTFGAGGGVATFINHGMAGPGGSAVGVRQEYAESVQQDGTGNAIVTYVVSTATGTDTLVARYHGLSSADGTLDTSFNTTGYFDLHSGSGSSVPVDAEVDSKGNIVGVESVGTVLTIFRLLTGGTLDSTFGSSGIVTFNPTGPSAAGAAVAGDTPADFIIDANGNYLIAGSSINTLGGTELAVWRYTSSGALDTTYGPAGTGYTAYQRSTGVDLAGQSGTNAIDLPIGSVYFDTLERVTIPVASRNGIGSNSDFGLLRFTSSATLDQ